MPLNHDFAGQVRLNNLAAATATQVDIPLFAGSSQPPPMLAGLGA